MIAHFIGGLFAGVWFYVVAAGVGAGTGVAGAIAGRIGGLTAAAGVGALVLVSAYAGGGVLNASRDQDKIERLEAELALRDLAIDEARATAAALKDTLEKEREAAELNGPLMAELEAMIAAGAVNPDCSLSGEFIDELEKLR